MTKYVFLTGPHSAFSREMEEYPQWYVSVGQDLYKEPDHHYKVNSFKNALRPLLSVFHSSLYSKIAANVYA